MKLHEVPNNTWITLNGEKLLFHHIDGMYSYCTTEDNRVVHLVAWAEVELAYT